MYWPLEQPSGSLETIVQGIPPVAVRKSTRVVCCCRYSDGRFGTLRFVVVVVVMVVSVVVVVLVVLVVVVNVLMPFVMSLVLLVVLGLVVGGCGCVDF
mmetsp:Transcript_122715/g.392969  ORF Transcript_122715/g.392969 Transcript_122715/m.392969 type:complete len:98 (-) Transcript_122715:232-525(-)